MPTLLRIATFNLEELDYPAQGKRPTFDERLRVMQPQLRRVRADILCLQEVSAQGQPRQLSALNDLINGTIYQQFNQAFTRDPNTNDLYADRNLVVLSRFPIADFSSILRKDVQAPEYQQITAIPKPTKASPVNWDRPILYVKIDVPGNPTLHMINLHLKSRLPSTIQGQEINAYTWRTAPGWAEGFFLSSMKRMGQAFETRYFIDTLFDADAEAWICVCGDLNADTDDVPVLAIRGDVEDTGNDAHAPRVMVPCERTIPEPARFSILHHGKGYMFDHLLVSRPLLAVYRRSEIHNELLHDESVAFATDVKFPESDHAPVVAEFELP